MWIFRNNVMYFKSQYKSYNPEDTFMNYSDVSAIKHKILTKSPYQAYHFLQNLRRAANLEG